MHRVRALLEDPWTRPVLWALQLLAIAVMMWSTRNEIFGDHASYLQLAEGILHGEYSHYWQLDVPVPDTFRTPGFPLYIAAVMTVFGSWKAIMWIHLALYLLAIHLTLRIIARFDPRSLAGNLALLFLLPLVNVPYYITQLSPEIPTLAAITTVIYLLVRKDRLSWVDAIALGLLYGFIFQCRPIYLWLPPVIAISAWWTERTAFDKRGHLVALSLFALTLLPYGFWNKQHHGVFQITPLEGGGGVVHMGIWSGLVPGHQEHRYWSNFAGDEIIRFTPADSITKNEAAYEADWDIVMDSLAPYMTGRDSVMLASFDREEGAVRTFNTRYTQERERLLKQHTIALALERPGYAIAYKSWSALRLWVIGIQRDKFLEASTFGKLKQLYPTLMTLSILLLSVVFITIAYRRKLLSMGATQPLWLHLLYFGLIHIPFVIQVRYTTPVRPAMVAFLALAVASVLFKRKEIEA